MFLCLLQVWCDGYALPCHAGVLLTAIALQPSHKRLQLCSPCHRSPGVSRFFKAMSRVQCLNHTCIITHALSHMRHCAQPGAGARTCLVCCQMASYVCVLPAVCAHMYAYQILNTLGHCVEQHMHARCSNQHVNTLNSCSLQVHPPLFAAHFVQLLCSCARTILQAWQGLSQISTAKLPVILS